MRRRGAKQTLLRGLHEQPGELYRPSVIRHQRPLPRTEIKPFIRVGQPKPLRRHYEHRSPRLALLLLLAVIATAVIYWSLRPAPLESRLVSPLEGGALGAQAPLPELPPSTESQVVHRLKRREDLGRMLARYNLDPSLAPEAQKALSSLGESSADSTRARLFFEPTGELRALRFDSAEGRHAVLARTAKGFQPSLVVEPKAGLERVVIGEVKSSFAAAANASGLPYEMIDDLVDVFSDRIEFNKDFQVGDRFTIIFREGQDRGRAPQLLAAAITVGGETLIAARYIGTDGRARYFNEKGQLIGGSFLRYPVAFTRISSYVSDSRFHPVLHRRRKHNGVDFAAPTGTPVRTVADGRIIFAGYKGPNGKMVQIRHSDRYTTAYLHLSKISKGITRGTAVTKGQLIGAVGSTGLSTGPHLHYSLFDRGKYVDPLKTRLPTAEEVRGGNAIRKKYLTRVLFTLSHYQNFNLDNLARATTVQ